MWLKVLGQWLKCNSSASDERWQEKLRAERDCDDLELRKAKASPWYLSQQHR